LKNKNDESKCFVLIKPLLLLDSHKNEEQNKGHNNDENEQKEFSPTSNRSL